MRGKLILAGVVAASGYGLHRREDIKEQYDLIMPIAKAYHAKATSTTLDFVREIEDIVSRVRWAYRHPEVLGYPSRNSGAAIGWLDPFYGERPQNYRRKENDYHNWTWKDAPNVKVPGRDEEGNPVDVEVKPMGKILATLQSNDPRT